MNGNKSRSERPHATSQSPSSKRVRSTKKKSFKSKKGRSKKPKKYVPGEFIFDTKGQMAEIKYIGQCHKGAGTWYGIEFVDGSLGKHNGQIDGKIYFQGMDRRCAMIRVSKIRSKAPGPSALAKKSTSSTSARRLGSPQLGPRPKSAHLSRVNRSRATSFDGKRSIVMSRSTELSDDMLSLYDAKGKTGGMT